MQNLIYFDHNATTHMSREVFDAMSDVMQSPLNASSVHTMGRRAKQLLESARVALRKVLNVDSSYNVIFTASATESNNLALRGLAGYKSIASVIEHSSVLNNVKDTIIPVNSDGVIEVGRVAEIIAKNSGEKFLVSVIFASNETGAIQPIREIANIVHKYGGILHTDATQALGKVQLDLKELGADLITVSAHKFGGPIGVGALIYKKDIELTPIITGGGQEYRIRSGTYNIAAIHGFGVACDVFARCRFDNQIEGLRDFLEGEILKVCKDSIIFGKNVKRLPNTSMFTMPFVDAATQVIHFDSKNIMVSAGAACSSGRVDLPRVVMSMGYPQSIASTAIRVSLGQGNTKSEVKKFIAEWSNLYNFIKNKGHENISANG